MKSQLKKWVSSNMKKPNRNYINKMEVCKKCNKATEPFMPECTSGCEKNYCNEYNFSMSLMNGQNSNNPVYDTLDFEIMSFFESNYGGLCDTRFSIIANKGFGKGDSIFKKETFLCEEIQIDQLERLYNFLKVVLYKS